MSEAGSSGEKESSAGSSGITRRSFLKGSAVVAAGAAALTGINFADAEGASVPENWDEETDVVVVGSGTASVAAITAHAAGNDVTLLEKAPFFGGTTALSGGGLWIPNNYLLEEHGVEDSREKALTYLRHVAKGQSSEELMSTYVDKGDEMLQWLRDNAGFSWERNKGPSNFADYYPYEGSLDGGIARTVYPAPLDDGTGGGQALTSYARQANERRGIDVRLQTPATQLVTSDDDVVEGVITESGNQRTSIRARKGVLLGTGGFEHNEAMRKHFMRFPLHAANSVPTNTGDGHLMGMMAGADLGNMNECWGVPFFKPNPEKFSGIGDWQMFRGKPGAIVVNEYGERTGNESAAYDPANKAFNQYDTGSFEWRNIPSYFVCDAGFTERYPLPDTQYQVGEVPDWFTAADSLEELASELGIDPSGLKETVDFFNEHAREGNDPVWHRGEYEFDKWTAGDNGRDDLSNPCLAPLETSPYYAAPIWPGTCGTNGGLKTNAKAQVLNARGEVIPKLYATGNTMASVMGVGYAGGGATIGAGMTFAYIAGKNMAEE